MLIDSTALIAPGRNALAPGETTGTIAQQFALPRAALRAVMPFIRRGSRLVIYLRKRPPGNVYCY